MAQAAAPVPVRRESPERWHKALERALAGGVEVFRVAGTGEMVATSATQLDTVYRVTGRECECAAALAGDPICVHRAAARFILGWLREEPAAEPAAAVCIFCRGAGRIANPHRERLDACNMCGGSGAAPLAA